MTIKGRALVRGTVSGAGDAADAQGRGLIGEDLTKIEVPWSIAVGRPATADNDFRTHFITLAANTNTAVHYDLRKY